MDRLQQALDALIRELRRGAILREHVFSILFYATGAAAARVLTAKWTLDTFVDRPIGAATIGNVSVGQRTAVYVQAILLFVLVAVIVAKVLPRLVAWLGNAVGRALEATSLCGLLLFLMASWRVDTRGAMCMLLGAQVLVVAPALFDRLLERVLHRPVSVDVVRDPGAYAAWIGGTGFALLEPLIDFGVRIPGGIWSVPAFTVAFGLGLDLLRRLLCAVPPASRVDRAAASDRIVHALTPLAALAAARILRNELYLLLNENGHYSIRPENIEIGVCVLVGLWCVWRAVRGPRPVQRLPDGRLDVERLVGRFTFPWILAGVVALTRFQVQHGNSPDLLEPANGGLMIQQWFDFGRLPFLETFGAHGLSDSFFGFIFAGLTGFREPTWMQYDYLSFVLTVLIGYHVLRAWWSSAAAGLFCAVVLPRMNDFLPEYCVQVGVSVFVVRWVAQKRTVSAWAVFAGWIVLVFSWRLDMGFANALASIGALLALVVLVPEHRLPIRAMFRGWILFAVGFVAVFLVLCFTRGIDPLAWFQDFRAVIGSNQAFGFARMAHDRNEIVLVHSFLLPILVFLTCAAALIRLRGRVEPRDKLFFAALGTAYFSAYYFANFPRGLVRHTFLEAPNVVISSFAFLVLAGSWRWLLPESRRVAAFGAFFFTASALCYELDLGASKTRRLLAPTTTFERLAYALRTTPRVPYQPRRIERTERGPWFEGWMSEFLPFIQTELRPDETFLDLSNNPLLYYHAHRRSPHWLNHVLLVYGERLQTRFIEDLESQKVPFVILPSVPALARARAQQYLPELDGVTFTLRHYRIFEWVYAHYEPLTLLGSWPVWVRKDRLLAGPPSTKREESDASDVPRKRRLFALSEAGGAQATGPQDLAVKIQQAAAVHAPGPVVLAVDKVCALRIGGKSEKDARLDVELGFGGDRELAPMKQPLLFPAGRNERWFWIPRTNVPRLLTALALSSPDAFELEFLELWEFDSPACRALDDHLAVGETTFLDHLAWLWAEHDTDAPASLKVLRTLTGVELDAARGSILPAPEDDATWSRGIHRHEAAFRISSADRERRVEVGDQLQFSQSGVRRVTAVDGPDVHVDGAPLDPEHDGNPRVARFVAAGAQPSTSTLPRHPLTYAFDPVKETEGEPSAYVHLRLRAKDGTDIRLVVAYGQGSQGVGRFMLKLRPDDQAHDYLVRISSQANWHLFDCDWIRLLPSQGAVEVESATITAGD